MVLGTYGCPHNYTTLKIYSSYNLVIEYNKILMTIPIKIPIVIPFDKAQFISLT